MALDKQPQCYVKGRDGHDEEEKESGEQGMVLGLKLERVDADLKAHEGEGIQSEQQAVTKNSGKM
jgi:hypothetical protein